MWHRLRAAYGEARMWLALGRALGALAPTPAARRNIRFVTVWLPLRDALGARTRKARRITLTIGGEIFKWSVGRRTDLAVAREVLLEGEYADVPLAPPVRTIVDLGSHVGFSVLFFRAAYPAARIVAVEPDPATARALRTNLMTLQGVEVREVALTSTNGVVDFHPAVQGWISSLRNRGDDAEQITVVGCTLDSLLADVGVQSVDLLKIDVEGEELAVLRASERLADVRAIVGELHDPDQLPELRAVLQDFDVEVRNVTADHMAFSAVRTPRREPPQA